MIKSNYFKICAIKQEINKHYGDGVNELFKFDQDLDAICMGSEITEEFSPFYNFIIKKDKDYIKLQKKDNFKKLKTKNLTGVQTTIYNFDGAMKEDLVFICEGWCDALSIENETCT